MTVISKMWPVPIQGSLVMKMSPGRVDSGGKRSRKCGMESDSVPTNAGAQYVDWLSRRPCLSKTAQQRSKASRTMVEKAVRMRARNISSGDGDQAVPLDGEGDLAVLHGGASAVSYCRSPSHTTRRSLLQGQRWLCPPSPPQSFACGGQDRLYTAALSTINASAWA